MAYSASVVEAVKEALAGAGQPQPLDIEGPPCRSCQHWRPYVKLTPYPPSVDVTLCTASEMFQDFSCYRPKA